MDVDVFYRAYREAHPLAGMDDDSVITLDSTTAEEEDAKLQYLLTETALANKLKQISFMLQKIHANNKSWARDILDMHPDVFPELKGLWLFSYGVPRDFFRDLQRIVITHNDTSYTEGDYALLVYISYQTHETVEMLKDVPFSMIRDMYEPIMDEKFNEWYSQADN
jgi:hypothetical protein